MTAENFLSKNAFISQMLSRGGTYGSSGIVKLIVPTYGDSFSNKAEDYMTYIDNEHYACTTCEVNNYTRTIVGFIDNEITLSMGSTWGSIIPDLSSLNEALQIMGYSNVLTWAQASAAAWKSTQPLKIDLDMYLVTLYRGQESILRDVAALTELTALHITDGDFATAKVHGGYKVDYATPNRNLALSDLDTIYTVAGESFTSGEGTITLLTGGMTINNLLLEDVKVTHSAAYVDDVTPLYVRLSLSLRTSRALITSDIREIYKNAY